MINTKIEETRNYLMEQYGYPTVQKFGTMTYRFVNTELNSFNRLISAYVQICELLKIEDYQNSAFAICEYCKVADPANMDIISNKLEGILKELNRRVNYTRKGFRNLVEELNEVLPKKDFNPHLVINYFVANLKIRAVSYNIKNENRNIDRDGNSFWGGNKGFNK